MEYIMLQFLGIQTNLERRMAAHRLQRVFASHARSRSPRTRNQIRIQLRSGLKNQQRVRGRGFQDRPHLHPYFYKVIIIYNFNYVK